MKSTKFVANAIVVNINRSRSVVRAKQRSYSYGFILTPREHAEFTSALSFVKDFLKDR